MFLTINNAGCVKAEQYASLIYRATFEAFHKNIITSTEKFFLKNIPKKMCTFWKSFHTYITHIWVKIGKRILWAWYWRVCCKNNRLLVRSNVFMCNKHSYEMKINIRGFIINESWVLKNMENIYSHVTRLAQFKVRMTCDKIIFLLFILFRWIFNHWRIRRKFRNIRIVKWKISYP